MKRLTIGVRLARPEECDFIFKIRNEKSIRAVSSHVQRISLSVHRRWFQAALHNPEVRIFIIRAKRRPVGMIRYNVVRPRTCEIHMALFPAWRGQGIAEAAFRKTTARIKKILAWKVRRIIARIKPANKKSIRFFSRIGFRKISRDVSWPSKDVLLVFFKPL